MLHQEQPSAIFASEVALRARARLTTRSRTCSEIVRKSTPVNPQHDRYPSPHREKNADGFFTGGTPPTEERPQKTPFSIRKLSYRKKKNKQPRVQLTKEQQALQKELCSSLAKLKETSEKTRKTFLLKSPKWSRKYSWLEGSSARGSFQNGPQTTEINRRFSTESKSRFSDRVEVTTDDELKARELRNHDVGAKSIEPRSRYVKLFSPKSKRRLFVIADPDAGPDSTFFSNSEGKDKKIPSAGEGTPKKPSVSAAILSPFPKECKASHSTAPQRKVGLDAWEWLTKSKDSILKYAHIFSPPNATKTSAKDSKETKKEVAEGEIEGSEGKKHRDVSLRRLSRSRHNNERPPVTSDSNATQSDTEVGKISGSAIRVSNGGLAPDSPIEMSTVGAWATSFEKLIEDSAGLHTFAEFLKKEYSHENIYFWTACERYKLITDDEERREIAKAIFDRHLGMAASEPVNVDAHARQIAQEGLANPNEFLFAAAQKQIFTLMKFDSYSRFLTSELYKKCLIQEKKGLPLPYPGDDTLDPDLGIFPENFFSKHLKKSKSDAEERRRKSLLPWHRKDRSKSKDRGETEYWRRKKMGHRTPSESSSTRYDLSDSHTSLSSSDFAPGNRAVSKESLTSGEAVSLSGSEGLNLCRFILPDQSNSVLAVRSGETVKELVRQLLERRRINFTKFNVILTKGNKSVDLNMDSTVLGGHEARLERMVLFSLYLPSRKTVFVKAKPHKLISEVLKPILTKYGLKLDLMVIHKYGEAKGINVKGQVNDLDGEKLIVQTKEEIKEWADPGRHSKRNNTLDEITNKVFEDVLNGKTKSSFDDLGVLDFDSRSTKTDPTSDTSSSLMGSFSRRESLSLERNPHSRQPGGGRGLLNDPPFGGKRREAPAYNMKSKQEDAELYEGLKRAQMCRLDDQRGTEINFELPDFLKSDRSQESNINS